MDIYCIQTMKDMLFPMVESLHCTSVMQTPRENYGTYIVRCSLVLARGEFFPS